MGDVMSFNSRLFLDDPRPWSVYQGMGLGSERHAREVVGAVWKPREFPTRYPSKALARFRESTLLMNVDANYNAEAWLNMMAEFPGHMEATMDAAEVPHLVRVLRRLVNVYGEA